MSNDNNKIEELKEKKWINKADVEKGKFEKWCKAHGFKGVNQACVNLAAKTGGHAAKMALFACNMPNSPYTYPKKTKYSKEENIMAKEKEEQLYRDVNPKKQLALAKEREEKEKEVKEESVEEAKEEVVEEVSNAVVEENPEEEVKEEVKEEEENEEPEEEKDGEPKEEKKEKEEAEEEPINESSEERPDETLSKEIKETKEELAVIKEVRDELVNLYSKYGKLEKQKEALLKKIEKLEKEKLELNEQLNIYKEREEKLNAQRRLERLERLSAKFKLLGQEKSVEQLAEKDEKTIEEFEAIVDSALEKAGETKEMPEVTTPSQATGAKEEATEESKEEPKEEKREEVAQPPEQMTNEAFFTNILKKLTKEQMKSNRGRTLIL